MDDKIIEIAWKRAETSEIETLAQFLEDAARDHGSELDLSHILYLAFRCGFKTALNAH